LLEHYRVQRDKGCVLVARLSVQTFGGTLTAAYPSYPSSDDSPPQVVLVHENGRVWLVEFQRYVVDFRSSGSTF
jgi:hypothetical protein